VTRVSLRHKPWLMNRTGGFDDLADDTALQGKLLGSRLFPALPHSSVRFRKAEPLSGAIDSRPGKEDISYVNEEQVHCSPSIRRSLE
jgi:hypothetical protein